MRRSDVRAMGVICRISYRRSLMAGNVRVDACEGRLWVSVCKINSNVKQSVKMTPHHVSPMTLPTFLTLKRRELRVESGLVHAVTAHLAMSLWARAHRLITDHVWVFSVSVRK